MKQDVVFHTPTVPVVRRLSAQDILRDIHLGKQVQVVIRSVFVTRPARSNVHLCVISSAVLDSPRLCRLLLTAVVVNL